MKTLRLFCDVARLRSFSQAAAKHGITQSAASQRISQLEARLGVALLDRSVRPLALTPAGQRFYQGSLELLRRYDRLVQELTSLTSAPSGQVRVVAIYSAGIDLLNQVKENFEKAFPRIRVLVEYKRPEQVHQAVLAGHADLGIISYPRRWPGVGVIPLRNERMAVVTAPGHPLARRSRITARKLASWPMIGFEPGMPVEQAIRRYLRHHGVQPNVTAAFDNVDSIKNAVALSSDHLAILPRRTVLRELSLGTLAVIDLEPPLYRPLGIIYHKPALSPTGEPIPLEDSHALDPATQAFVNFLLQHAGPHAEESLETMPLALSPTGASQ